jgi:hypothetical protein
MPQRLAAGETRRDPVDHCRELHLPPIWVYAMSRGDRSIFGCLHKPRTMPRSPLLPAQTRQHQQSRTTAAVICRAGIQGGVRTIPPLLTHMGSSSRLGASMIAGKARSMLTRTGRFTRCSVRYSQIVSRQSSNMCAKSAGGRTPCAVGRRRVGSRLAVAFAGLRSSGHVRVTGAAGLSTVVPSPGKRQEVLVSEVRNVVPGFLAGHETADRRAWRAAALLGSRYRRWPSRSTSVDVRRGALHPHVAARQSGWRVPNIRLAGVAQPGAGPPC